MSNREIKFRAWDKEASRMFYLDDIVEILTDALDAEEHWLKCTDHALMQYTGLKDKNGQEIYEGDIVRYNYWGHFHQNILVEYQEVAGSDDMGTDMIGFMDVSSGEIIGNIYENPDLIGE
jgi:uncharacterized phage protein (TIGR01671 family)